MSNGTSIRSNENQSDVIENDLITMTNESELNSNEKESDNIANSEDDEDDPCWSEPPAKTRKTSDRPKRLRKQPERLGATEDNLNDDALFEEADRPHSVSVRTDSETSGSNSEVISLIEKDLTKEQRNDKNTENSLFALMSAGEKAIFKMLVDISADITLLKQTSVGIETKCLARPLDNVGTIEIVNKRKLSELELPLTTKESLGKFEYRLSDQDFEKKAASHFWTSLIFFYIFF